MKLRLVALTAVAASMMAGSAFAQSSTVNGAAGGAVTGAISMGIIWQWHAWDAHLVPNPPSPLIPILLAALAAKDFIVLAQPMRSPFEAVLRQISGG